MTVTGRGKTGVCRQDSMNTVACRLLLALIACGLILFQGLFGNGIALAAAGDFNPNAVLEGLIGTCGLIILVAGGVLGVKMFFKGQIVQAIVAVVVAAFIFVLLNKGDLNTLGKGLKDFLFNPGAGITTTGNN